MEICPTHNQLVGDLGRCHSEADNVQYYVLLENISWRLYPDSDSQTDEKTNWTEWRQYTCTLPTNESQYNNNNTNTNNNNNVSDS